MFAQIWNAIKRWRFAFILAAGLIAFELLMVAMALRGAPAGHVWLGNFYFNADDIPVYLNYLRQGAHSLGLVNLYSDLPQTPRFDPFWSVGGLLLRTGMAPLTAHETLRWLATVFLAFALYATAKSVCHDGRHAKWMAALLALGVPTGWLDSLILRLSHQPDYLALPSPQLSTEFSIPPLLLGGAHMIASVAALVLVMRWAWEAVHGGRPILMRTWLVAAWLFGFQPYFIAPVCLASVLALAWPRGTATRFKRRLWRWLIFITAALPATSYFAYLVLADAALRQKYFVVNYLPLNPGPAWLVALSPFALAAIYLLWRGRGGVRTDTAIPPWAVAWLVSAGVCILFVPWKQKMTEGLEACLLLTTLPAWIALLDRLTTKITFSLSNCLIAGYLSLSLFQQFVVQTAFQSDSRFYGLMYAPTPIVRAWAAISGAADCLALATGRWTTAWAPVFTGCRVWIGHPHETPDFKARQTEYDTWRATLDPAEFNGFLDRVKINYLLTYPADQTDRTTKLIGVSWSRVFQADGAAVWRRAR